LRFAPLPSNNGAGCRGAPVVGARLSLVALRAQSVTLHTNLGDVKLEVYCDEVPRAAENFLALCASGYYDGTRFHR
jgi:hypothetical protein